MPIALYPHEDSWYSFLLEGEYILKYLLCNFLLSLIVHAGLPGIYWYTGHTSSMNLLETKLFNALLFMTSYSLADG
jgi:hypothetical protein